MIQTFKDIKTANVNFHLIDRVENLSNNFKKSFCSMYKIYVKQLLSKNKERNNRYRIIETRFSRESLSSAAEQDAANNEQASNVATDMQEVVYEKFRNLIREQIEELNEKVEKNRRHLRNIGDHQQSAEQA